MDRRFLTVLGVSLVFALVVSSVFYQMTARSSTSRPQQTDTKDLVVATRPLGIGVTVKPADVKVVKITAEAFPKGAFARVEEVIDRPIISNILIDEPVLEGRLAARGSGLGLAPVIPVGMRAVSVRVNDVAGVAGFVQAGMRVDVLVTGRPPNGDTTVVTTTRTGELKGKFGYMSPEGVNGEAIDLRADVFACGVVLWESLANKRLFKGENQLRTITMVREAKVPPITQLNPGVPPTLERILLRALSRDPEFTAGFLKRHENKLIFGSDCACADGKGGGVSQQNNPGASRLAGKCVARETLTILKKTVSQAAFRKLTWENAHRVYRLSAKA